MGMDGGKSLRVGRAEEKVKFRPGCLSGSECVSQ